MKKYQFLAIFIILLAIEVALLNENKLSKILLTAAVAVTTYGLLGDNSKT